MSSNPAVLLHGSHPVQSRIHWGGLDLVPFVFPIIRAAALRVMVGANESRPPQKSASAQRASPFLTWAWTQQVTHPDSTPIPSLHPFKGVWTKGWCWLDVATLLSVTLSGPFGPHGIPRPQVIVTDLKGVGGGGGRRRIAWSTTAAPTAVRTMQFGPTPCTALPCLFQLLYPATSEFPLLRNAAGIVEVLGGICWMSGAFPYAAGTILALSIPPRP